VQMTNYMFCNRLDIIPACCQIAGATVSQFCRCQGVLVCLDQPHPTTSTLHTSKASYLSAGAAGEDVIRNLRLNVQYHPFKLSNHPRHDQCRQQAVYSVIYLTPSDHAASVLLQEPQYPSRVDVRAYARSSHI
jgi:hypothetical protein